MLCSRLTSLQLCPKKIRGGGWHNGPHTLAGSLHFRVCRGGFYAGCAEQTHAAGLNDSANLAAATLFITGTGNTSTQPRPRIDRRRHAGGLTARPPCPPPPSPTPRFRPGFPGWLGSSLSAA